jgi:TonB family protein
VQRNPARFLFVLFVFPLFAPRAMAQDFQAAPGAFVPAQVPYSTEGFQAQIDELVRIAKLHDDASWSAALNAFSLPNPAAWIEANFASANVAKLTEDYPKVRDGHLAHLSSVLGHNVDTPGFSIKVEPSRTPAPPSDTATDSSLPLPVHPVAVQNFRLTPVADSGTMPPSWVSSFVYVDDRFRIVGGTYSFWVEELQRMLQPTRVRFGGTVQSARLIHKVAPKYPKEARKKHVEGVVRLHAIIGKDGSVHDIEMVSGDPLLIDAAIKAVRQWRYATTTLNGMPVEVSTIIDVIFKLNQ